MKIFEKWNDICRTTIFTSKTRPSSTFGLPNLCTVSFPSCLRLRVRTSTQTLIVDDRFRVGECDAGLCHDGFACPCNWTFVSNLHPDPIPYPDIWSRFVFADYVWNPDGSPYSHYNGKLIPSRIPLTALVGGKFHYLQTYHSM